jgi:hypothetical protein
MTNLPFSLHNALGCISEWRRTPKWRFIKRRLLMDDAFIWIEMHAKFYDPELAPVQTHTEAETAKEEA